MDLLLDFKTECIYGRMLFNSFECCFRNFWRSRRNGPLRYIIPYRDDQPPPYSQANGAAASTGNDVTDAGNYKC
jgi:hypothetical protein